MRLPRDISGDELARLLRRRYGYTLARQRGSHMRLVARVGGEERGVTVPRRKDIPVGTLANILSDVSDHFGLTQEEVGRILFGD